MRRLLFSLFLACACGETESPPPVADRTAPVVAISPPAGTYTGATLVTLSTGEPSQVTYTVDGSDPATSATAKTGASPQTVLLEAPARVTLRVFATDSAGNRSETKEAVYELRRSGLAPASIAGTAYAVDALRTGSVAIALFDQDPRMPGGPTHAPLQYTVLGALASGKSDYSFQNLAAGTYWVLGLWSPPAGQAQVFAPAHAGALVLDPSVETKSRMDFVDVYLGSCDPEATGLDGEVVVADRLLTRNVAVGALAGPMRSDAQPAMIAMSGAPGPGARRPFALCDLPPGPAYVYSISTPPGATDPDTIVAHEGNPLDGTKLGHATLYLEAPAPGRGTITGTLHLSGPLPGLRPAFALTAEVPRQGVDVERYEVLDPVSGTELAYTLAAVPLGTWYVTAAVRHPAGPETFRIRPDPVELTATAPAATVDFEVGVGRLTGSIEVRHAPAGNAKVLVVAARTGSPPEASVAVPLGAADAAGMRRADYLLFGLADGTFTSVVVVDANVDGRFDDDAAAHHTAPGVPAVATVASGGETQVDFVVDLAP